MAAAEASRRGLLSSFITGAYPTPSIRKSVRALGLDKNRKVARLIARGEGIPDHLVHPLVLPEALHVMGRMAQAIASSFQAGETLNIMSLRQYGACATAHVRRAARNGARLYHYRAGFGHDSVRVAKEIGLITLCDHSAVHPQIFEWLIHHQGELPPAGAGLTPNAFWADVLDDINQADATLANSDFVKKTFVRQGFDADRLHVIYLGVDNAFLAYAACHRNTRQRAGGPLRILFAGSFEPRKGADVVIEALRSLADPRVILEIAGSTPTELRSAHPEFFCDPRVRELGLLSRAELAEAMSHAEVFLFPSLAEGSARVVFEALACGCYVITTANSGSIVEDGRHGRIVPPGDAAAVARAIEKALSERAVVGEIGQANAQLVKAQYRQDHYGEKLAKLYSQLLQ